MIIASGNGLIVTFVCAFAVHPFASIMLSVALYVPAAPYVTVGDAMTVEFGVPPEKVQLYVVPPDPKKFSGAPTHAGDVELIPATGSV